MRAKTEHEIVQRQLIPHATSITLIIHNSCKTHDNRNTHVALIHYGVWYCPVFASANNNLYITLEYSMHMPVRRYTSMNGKTKAKYDAFNKKLHIPYSCWAVKKTQLVSNQNPIFMSSYKLPVLRSTRQQLPSFKPKIMHQNTCPISTTCYPSVS